MLSGSSWQLTPCQTDDYKELQRPPRRPLFSDFKLGVAPHFVVANGLGFGEPPVTCAFRDPLGAVAKAPGRRGFNGAERGPGAGVAASPFKGFGLVRGLDVTKPSQSQYRG